MDIAERLETIYLSATRAGGTLVGKLGYAEPLETNLVRVTDNNGTSVDVMRDVENLESLWTVTKTISGEVAFVAAGSDELVYVIQECLKGLQRI